jgi:Fe-S-cluster containining protein
MRHNPDSIIKATSALGHWLDANKQHQDALDFVDGQLLDYRVQIVEGRKVNSAGVALGTYEALDELYEKSANPEKKNITCKRGCNFCCHIAVNITADEAKVIVMYAEDMHVSIDKEYLEGQQNVVPAEQALTPYAACVFLKKGECSIYPVRPMNCRKYFVVTPPKQCDASVHVSGVAVFFNLDAEILASAILSEVPYGLMATMLLKEIK